MKMDCKKMDQKDVAKRKILLQQKLLASNAASGKRRRRAKSASEKFNRQESRESDCIKNMTAPRRQSCPAMQPTTSHVKDHDAEPSHKVTTKKNYTSATTTATTETSREKSKEKVKTGRTMFVNATELPPLPERIRRSCRRSSFPLRKRVDNKLGYRGRERNRHTWQDTRHQNFRNYYNFGDINQHERSDDE